MKISTRNLEMFLLRIVLNPRVALFVILTIFFVFMYVFFGFSQGIIGVAGEGHPPPVYPENSTSGGGSG